MFNLISDRFTKVFLFVAIIAVVQVYVLPKTAAAQVKIMPIGDSITDLDGSYRCPLYDKLRSNGYSVKSIGSESDPYPRSGCSNGGNITHFGFSGVTLQGVRDEVRNRINSYEAADFALIHLGTNNYWPRSGKPYTADEHQGNLTAMKDLINIIRARSSSTRVLVAQIIGTSDSTMNGYIFTFNFSYLNTLSGQTGVYLVDQYNGYNPGSDSYDGVHPQEGAGNIKMADKWLATMLPLLRSQPLPTNSPTNPPTATAAPTAPSSVTPSVRKPYNGVTTTVPGRIEAENYDEGGMNLAYYDKSSGNNGNVYRNNDVDLESNRANGTSVGWFELGEWLTYTFRVTNAGTYQFAVGAAAGVEGGRFDLLVNSSNAGSASVPNSGNWFGWTTINAGTVNLSAGDHLLRVTAGAGNASAIANLDYIQVSAVSVTPTSAPPTNQPTAVPTTAPTQSPGISARLDLNGDGSVNAADITFMFSRWSL